MHPLDLTSPLCHAASDPKDKTKLSDVAQNEWWHDSNYGHYREKKKTVLTMETAGQGTLMITQTQIAHVHIGL